MTVQPPKKEDLQKSYATVVAQETNPKGWYGSMSTFLFLRLSFLPLSYTASE